MNVKQAWLIPLVLIYSIAISPNLAHGSDGFCTLEAPCPGYPVDNQAFNKTPENESICIYYFYGQGCPHCARIGPFIEGLTEKYNQTELKKYEIYYNKSNQDFFNDFNKRYDIKQPGVPAVFVGDRALIGENVIRENLENSIKHFIENGNICPLTVNKVQGVPHEISPAQKTELTIPVIVTAALFDSINPCAFAVLIFLLVYLMALGAKRRILKVGLTYISVVFIVYFLSGLGLFTVIQTTGLTRLVFNIAAWIAIIAGLINVKDFFWYGKGISLKIPDSKKPLLKKYIQKASIPAAVVLGFLVSMFELPCTGGVYLAILGLLADKMTRIGAIPYLLLYNFIFVLPLIIILFLVYKGVSPEKLEKWRTGKRKWMRLMMGIFMIGLGMVMLMGWL